MSIKTLILSKGMSVFFMSFNNKSILIKEAPMSKSHKSLSAICTAVFLTTMMPSLEATAPQRAEAQKKAQVAVEGATGLTEKELENDRSEAQTVAQAAASAATGLTDKELEKDKGEAQAEAAAAAAAAKPGPP